MAGRFGDHNNHHNDHQQDHEHDDRGDFKMSIIGNNTSYTYVSSNLTNPGGALASPPVSPDPSYGSHIFLVGSNKILYPDLNTLTLLADGSTINSPVTNDHFSFASNLIIVLGSSDSIFGTMNDLDLNAIKGGVISNSTFTYGSIIGGNLIGNVILVGNSNDTVYGTLHDINLTADGTGSLITSDTFTFGSNIIIAGGGSNTTAYGTMNNLNLTATNGAVIGGTAGYAFTYGSLVGSTLVGNTLIVGNGAGDILYGTMLDLIVSASAITTSGVDTTSAGSFSFGNNTLTAGNGAGDQLYGDMANLAFQVQAGLNVSQTLGGASATTPITVAFGNNTLTAGNGAGDVLVGGVDTILLSATAGIANTAPANATLQNIKLIMGSDYLYAGNGGDTLYGDVRLITLESTAGTAAGNQSSGSTIRPLTFQGGVNYLYGGNGNDFLYGNVGTLSISLTGGTNSGLSANPFATAARLYTSTFAMGQNYLDGGNGNDSLYGDVGTLTLFAQGGSGNSSILAIPFFDNTPDLFTMGQNHLYGGDGNNLLVGDIGTLNINAFGGNVTVNTVPSNTFSYALVQVNFNMGNNDLHGGNGNDSLYGDIENFNISAHGGTAIGPTATNTGINAAEGFANPRFFGGHNMLIAGDGNDLLVGDIGHWNISITGGFCNTDNTFSSASADWGGGNLSPTHIMGNNTLIAGNGVDALYGSIQSINVVLQGGTNVGSTTSQLAAIAGIFPSPTFETFLKIGDNHLYAGNGGDTLYGDDGTFNITTINGTGIGTISESNGIKIYFGNNDLHGGNGNDVLYGNEAVAGELHFFLQGYLFNSQPGTSYDPRFLTLPDLITFGNNTLDGGAGNDFLVGDVFSMPGLVDGQANNLGESLRPTDPLHTVFTSALIWGNSTLTGGLGSDKFVFTLDDHMGTLSNPLMSMQGAQIVTDFTPSQGDKLVFGNVLGANGVQSHDAAILDSVTSFVNFMVNGEHEEAIIFHDASVSSATAAADYTAAIGAFLAAQSAYDTSHSITETNLQILQDVAQFIYQSGVATALTGAGNVSVPVIGIPPFPALTPTSAVLPATGETLANHVSPTEAPQGAVILEGHQTSDAGFSSFGSMATVLSTSLDIHADTASIHPWG